MGMKLPGRPLCTAAGTVSPLASFKAEHYLLQTGAASPFCLQTGQKQSKKVCWCLQGIWNFISWATLQIHWTAILTTYTEKLSCGTDLSVICEPGFCHYHLCFTASATKGGRRVCCKLRVSGRLSSINHSSLSFLLLFTLNKIHTAPSQTGSSTSWLTGTCKRSFLLSNLDYAICLGRRKWQGSAL